MHCATDYGRKKTVPIKVIEANLLLPINLLHLASLNNVDLFINTDTILDKRINYYSLSKKQFKDWLLCYKDNFPCVNIALDHFYGSGDDKTKFASYIINQLLCEVDKIDLTLGQQKRGFMYIDDVVEAFWKIIIHSKDLSSGFYDFQVSNHEHASIKELVLMVKDLTGNKKTALNFGILLYRENEVMQLDLDVSEIEKLNWKAKYSLKSGLKKTIAKELLKSKI